MNSVSRPATIRVQHNSFADHVGAYRMALDLFGRAELTQFLPESDHENYLQVLCELACAELAHSFEIGAPIELETYQTRFPELFAHPPLVHRLAQEDFHQRLQLGEAPELADYARRFQGEPAEPRDDVPPTIMPTSMPRFDADLTRQGRPGEKRGDGKTPSDPEIVWKINNAALEMPKVGDEFLGFSLLAELGKGAFGKVFLAQQADLAGRFVALKVAAGLFGESQTLAQLQHTHIVPIYSYHRAPLFQAVCMPYLGSTTLAHVLADIRTHKCMPSSGKDLLSTVNLRRKSTRVLDELSKGSQQALEISHPDAVEAEPVKRAMAASLELEGMTYVDSILWLGRRLADGLAHAHDRGILHRDLKPANILLTDDGQPMLLDFNLAQDTKDRDNAAAAAVGGTLPYMAPEHLEAFRGATSVVDARSDLYSLGVILFELLTAASPFPAYRRLPVREAIARMIADRHEGAPALHPLNPSIPPAVEAIVRKCLETDPVKRYQSARQLQEDLQRQMEHKPLVHARNTSLRERVRKFRRRHPKLTSATAVACAAALLIAGLASVFAVREEQHARLEARAALTRFHDDAQLTHTLLNVRSAKDQLEEGRAACQSALAQFEVLDNPNWRDGPAIRRLPPEQRAGLESDIGQLLVLLAQTQQLAGETEKDYGRREKLFHEGLQLCSLATDCFPADETPMALWKQKGELHQRLNEHERAREAFERAERMDLKTPHDRYLAARQLAEQGKYRSALPLLRQAIRAKPQDYNFHFLQGVCHDYLAQYTEALACYRTCIALRPAFWAAHYNRGLTYLRQNRCEAAIADFNETERLRPEWAEVFVQRAMAWQGLGKNVEGVADLSKAIELGCGETRVYFLRSRMREKSGDAAGAKKDFAEGMRREPTDERSWIARGIARLARDPKGALQDFDRALAINPRSLAGLQNKAHVLGKYLKRLDDAVDALNQAVEHYPDDCRPIAGRGVYLARLGRREAALKDAKQAVLLDTNPPNLYQVAGIYALTSKQEPADEREGLRLLSTALKSGFGFDYLEVDRDLDPIRSTPTFRRLVDGARALRTAASRR